MTKMVNLSLRQSIDLTEENTDKNLIVEKTRSISKCKNKMKGEITMTNNINKIKNKKEKETLTMTNMIKRITSGAMALFVAVSMTACTHGTSSVSVSDTELKAVPDVVITEVSEEIPEEIEIKEEIPEEKFEYISELSERSLADEGFVYTDYRNNIVEEPVMSIFGNTFNGKRVTTAEEFYNEIFYATLRGDTTIDLILDGNFRVDNYKLESYSVGVYVYRPEYESNRFRYTISSYYPGDRVLKAIKNGTVSSLSASDKKLYNKAKNIVDTYTSPSNSDYQNAKILYDYLAKNVCYDWSLKNRTANGALFDGKTVCSGYAESYAILLQLAGIDAYVVTGVGYTGGTSGGHAWNMANIDGKWLYFDLTWDDPDCGNFMFYDYFAISESKIAKDHSWERGVTDLFKRVS